VQGLKADIVANWQNDATFLRVKGIVPTPWASVNTAPATIPSGAGASFDMLARKLVLIRDYAQHVGGVTDAAIQARIQKYEGAFCGLLQKSSMTALRGATVFLSEIKDDIYPDSLEKALQAIPPEASIEFEPPLAYERVPLEFRIRFNDPVIDSAAARRELSCAWDFGDNLKERGWAVCHYFVRTSSTSTFRVVATFCDEGGRALLAANGKPVTLERVVDVRPSRDEHWVGERSVVELLKLAAALLIAVFALASGARDQIAKLDVLPGVIAVFMIGFSADTIKSLLSPSKT
jgi:hypothetical protein